MMKFDDLKERKIQELDAVCAALREKILQVVSKNGGHLSSNLGVIELTVALHYVFDVPREPLIFDVSHQCYAHKLLSGRWDEFATLRQFGGISGYTKPCESEYDFFVAGHSSTSISLAVGAAKAFALRGSAAVPVAIIGDGAIGGGVAYEALNELGDIKLPCVVVLNDNEMSISKPIGAISKYLSQMMAGQFYQKFKSRVNKFLELMPDAAAYMARRLEEGVRLITPGMLFEEMGLEYIGPVDGHDIGGLISALRTAREMRKPVVVHVQTIKGKGYEFSEGDDGRWHGVGAFDLATGEAAGSGGKLAGGGKVAGKVAGVANLAGAAGANLNIGSANSNLDENGAENLNLNCENPAASAPNSNLDENPSQISAAAASNSNLSQTAAQNPAAQNPTAPTPVAQNPTAQISAPKTATEIFSDELLRLAAADEKIVGVTAAMPSGTGLQPLIAAYPARFFDSGITEQHAVASMAALAKAGFKPFVAIYSTFLQRAFDQVVQEAAILALPLVFCLDRAGIVGEDGETHQGAFDVAFLRCVPNLTLCAPRNEATMRELMRFGAGFGSPLAIRYPRGAFRADAAGFTRGYAAGAARLGRGEIVRGGEFLDGANFGAAGCGADFGADFVGAGANSNLDGGAGNSGAAGYGGAAADKATCAAGDAECAFIGYGDGVGVALNVAARLGRRIVVADLAFVKPLDDELLARLAAAKIWFVFAPCARCGGVGEALAGWLQERGACVRVVSFELPDAFITHGKTALVEASLGLDEASLAGKVAKILG